MKNDSIFKTIVWLVVYMLSINHVSIAFAQETPPLKFTIEKAEAYSNERFLDDKKFNLHFSIRVNVQNTGDKSIPINVKGCPGEGWASDSQLIVVPIYACMQNIDEYVTLKPGEEYKGLSVPADLLHPENATQKFLTFRLGFKPLGSAPAEWSLPDKQWKTFGSNRQFISPIWTTNSVTVQVIK